MCVWDFIVEECLSAVLPIHYMIGHIQLLSLYVVFSMNMQILWLRDSNFRV